MHSWSEVGQECQAPDLLDIFIPQHVHITIHMVLVKKKKIKLLFRESSKGIEYAWALSLLSVPLHYHTCTLLVLEDLNQSCFTTVPRSIQTFPLHAPVIEVGGDSAGRMRMDVLPDSCQLWGGEVPATAPWTSPVFYTVSVPFSPYESGQSSKPHLLFSRYGWRI